MTGQAPLPEEPEGRDSGPDPGVEEIVRLQGENLADRLDVLLSAPTPKSVAEALRLAHNLKGLAVTGEDHPLRDLSRSLEAALTKFDPDDQDRRRELLSAVDAARGLIAGTTGAAGAARGAAAALEIAKDGRPPPALPAARRALLRRLQPLFQGVLQGLGAQLDQLEKGRDRRQVRAELVRELELHSAAAGVLGQTVLAAVGLEAAGLLESRSTPSSSRLASARKAWNWLVEEHPNEELDTLLSPALLSGLDSLSNESSSWDEERLPLEVEFPWPAVDQAGNLVRAIDRATAGRSIRDARPRDADLSTLRGTLGISSRQRHRREPGGTIQVPRRRLDRLLGLAEELVKLRTRTRAMDRLARDLGEAPPVEARLGLRRLARRSAELERDLDRLARTAREAVLRARRVPLRALFSLARVTLREYLSRHPGLAVELELLGGTTQVDKVVLDALVDPVLALLKNSLQHGVESQEERLAQGKPPCAKIRLAAQATPAGVVLEVEDDGRGLDERGLTQAGKKRGILLLRNPQEATLSLAFAPGVSTAAGVSDDAGRGLGLMAVLERIRSLRGRLVYHSTPGQGTLARLSVPPSATTDRVLLVRVGTERFALPMPSVLGVQEASTPLEAGTPLVRLLDLVDPPLPKERRQIPPKDVSLERRKRNRFTILIAPPFSHGTRGESRPLGCVVDDVLRRDLVVVRPLGNRFAPPGIDGAVLVGDEQLVLVVDVWRLYVSHQSSGFELPSWGA